MTAVTEVLESLRRALTEEMPDDQLGRVKVDPGPPRRRSVLYFAALEEAPGDYRWVVKRPAVDRRQEDLTSPLAAQQQFEALQRLHAHLLVHGNGVLAPRPVAMMPELDGYAMEYVPGASVRDLITVRALLDPAPLLLALDAAARALHAVHSLEPAEPHVVDVSDLRATAARLAPRLLAGTGVHPQGPRSPSKRPPPETDVDQRVVLHGDFAPENILLSDAGVYCLDADLATKGPAGNDVARFITMLSRRRCSCAVPTSLRCRPSGATPPCDSSTPTTEDSRPRGPCSRSSFSDWPRDAGRGTRILRNADPAWPCSGAACSRRHFKSVLHEVAAPQWPHRSSGDQRPVWPRGRHPCCLKAARSTWWRARAPLVVLPHRSASCSRRT